MFLIQEIYGMVSKKKKTFMHFSGNIVNGSYSFCCGKIENLILAFND